MATGTYLASTVVMGCIVAGLVYAAVNGRRWRHYAPSFSRPRSVDTGLLANTGVYIVGFAVLVVAATGGVFAVLEGGAGSTTLVIAGVAIAIVGFLVFGTYTAARSRGHPYAHAIAEAMGVLGGVVLLAIVLNLLTQFGAT